MRIKEVLSQTDPPAAVPIVRAGGAQVKLAGAENRLYLADFIREHTFRAETHHVSVGTDCAVRFYLKRTLGGRGALFSKLFWAHVVDPDFF